LSKLVDGLTTTGQILDGVNRLFTPTGAATILIEGFRAFLASRKARGEEVPVDLEEKLERYDAALDELEALVAEYKTIPQKPTDLQEGELEVLPGEGGEAGGDQE
jgi:hypothetical protein